MKPGNRSGFETALIAAFVRGADPVPDQGFSRAVMLRVRRRRMLRGLVLAAAGISGGLMAAWAVAGLVEDFTGLVLRLAGSWPDGSLPEAWQTLLVGVMAGVASVGAARLLDD